MYSWMKREIIDVELHFTSLSQKYERNENGAHENIGIQDLSIILKPKEGRMHRGV